MRDTLVEEVMSRRLAVAQERTSFREAARLMRRHRVTFLPVVDAYGALVGVLSAADLLPKLRRDAIEARPSEPESRARRTERVKAGATIARELMTSPAVAVTGDVPVAHAAHTMLQRQVRHLVVVDRDGRPAGVVSRTDLLTAFLRSDEAIHQDVQDLLEQLLGELASAVDFEVEQGVVVLSRRREGHFELGALARVVETVEGVVAARVAADRAIDRWYWPL